MIADIVPLDMEFAVEARFSPIDVGHAKPGHEAKIKITTFDFARVEALPVWWAGNT